MRTNILIPNKIVFILQWLFAILFTGWIITNNKYFAVVTGIFGIMLSIFTLFKPQTLPRSKILFPDNVPDNFFNWFQRLIHFIFLILSVFILFNYRVSNSREVGVLILVVVGAIVITDIFWLISYAQDAPSTSQSFAIFSFIFSLLVCVVGIVMIIRNSPIRMSICRPGIIGGAIGSIIGYILHIFMPIKRE